MLQSNNKHQWSPDGVNWVEIKFGSATLPCCGNSRCRYNDEYGNSVNFGSCPGNGCCGGAHEQCFLPAEWNVNSPKDGACGTANHDWTYKKNCCGRDLTTTITTNGGSAKFWPRDSGRDGDERMYLSFWGSSGHDGQYETGGCCSLSAATPLDSQFHYKGWTLPFAMSYVGYVTTTTTVTTSTTTDRTTTTTDTVKTVVGNTPISTPTSASTTTAVQFKHTSFTILSTGRPETGPIDWYDVYMFYNFTAIDRILGGRTSWSGETFYVCHHRLEHNGPMVLWRSGASSVDGAGTAHGRYADNDPLYGDACIGCGLFEVGDIMTITTSGAPCGKIVEENDLCSQGTTQCTTVPHVGLPRVSQNLVCIDQTCQECDGAAVTGYCPGASNSKCCPSSKPKVGGGTSSTIVTTATTTDNATSVGSATSTNTDKGGSSGMIVAILVSLVVVAGLVGVGVWHRQQKHEQPGQQYEQQGQQEQEQQEQQQDEQQQLAGDLHNPHLPHVIANPTYTVRADAAHGKEGMIVATGPNQQQFSIPMETSDYIEPVTRNKDYTYAPPMPPPTPRGAPANAVGLEAAGLARDAEGYVVDDYVLRDADGYVVDDYVPDGGGASIVYSTCNDVVESNV